MRCLVARVCGDRRLGKTELVSVTEGYARIQAGWWFIGPEPEDLPLTEIERIRREEEGRAFAWLWKRRERRRR